MTNLPKKLQSITETDGLYCAYRGGFNELYVYQDDTNPHLYHLIYCHCSEFATVKHETIPATHLELTMRRYQGDLRKWRKCEYGVE